MQQSRKQKQGNYSTNLCHTHIHMQIFNLFI